MNKPSNEIPSGHEIDPNRVEQIFATVHSKYGEFTPTLLHANDARGHLTYRVDVANNPTYVLKIHGENFGSNEGIAKEVDDRVVLRQLFEQAGLKHWVITTVLDHDPKDNWSLAKFERFQTLYELYKQDRVVFRETVLKLYETILIPLLQRLSADTVVPGDYGLDDIGYRDGTFYFYDIEKNKSLLKVIVDVYSKLIHLYARRLRAADAEGMKELTEILHSIRELQTDFVNHDAFNAALVERLRSPVLQPDVAGREAEIAAEFGYKYTPHSPNFTAGM